MKYLYSLILLFLCGISGVTKASTLPKAKQLKLWKTPTSRQNFHLKAHLIGHFVGIFSGLEPLPQKDDEIPKIAYLRSHLGPIGISKSMGHLLVAADESHDGTFGIAALKIGKNSELFSLPVKSFYAFLSDPDYQEDNFIFPSKFPFLSYLDPDTVCLVGKQVYLVRNYQQAVKANPEEEKKCREDVTPDIFPKEEFPKALDDYAYENSHYAFSFIRYFVDKTNTVQFALNSVGDTYLPYKGTQMLHPVCLIKDTEECEKTGFFLFDHKSLDIAAKCLVHGMAFLHPAIKFKNKYFFPAAGAPFHPNQPANWYFTLLELTITDSNKKDKDFDRGLCWPSTKPPPKEVFIPKKWRDYLPKDF